MDFMLTPRPADPCMREKLPDLCQGPSTGMVNVIGMRATDMTTDPFSVSSAEISELQRVGSHYLQVRTEQFAVLSAHTANRNGSCSAPLRDDEFLSASDVTSPDYADDSLSDRVNQYALDLRWKEENRLTWWDVRRRDALNAMEGGGGKCYLRQGSASHDELRAGLG